MDIEGNELTAIGHIDILRGDEVIYTVENSAPGAQLSYTDNSAQQGNNTYKVIPYSTTGDNGLDVEGTVYCGVVVPDLPTNVVLSSTVTWQPSPGMRPLRAKAAVTSIPTD